VVLGKERRTRGEFRGDDTFLKILKFEICTVYRKILFQVPGSTKTVNRQTKFFGHELANDATNNLLEP